MSKLGLFFLLLLCILTSALSLKFQIKDPESLPLQYQVLRHHQLLNAQAENFNPWQYRIMSAIVLEGIIKAFRQNDSFRQHETPSSSLQNMNELRVSYVTLYPYLLLRFLQNIIIFLLSLYLLKLLEIDHYFLKILSILTLGYTFSVAHYNSGLSFDNYFDIIFYQLALIALLQQRLLLLIPLCFLAATNRETGFLICLFPILLTKDWKFNAENKKLAYYSTLNIIAFTIPFYAIRCYFGYQEPQITGSLIENISSLTSYREIFWTYNLAPLIALVFFKRWPKILKNCFWLIIPIWLIIHFCYARVEETRLFLVPFTLIILPALICIIQQTVQQKKILLKS